VIEPVTPNPRVNTDAQTAGFAPLFVRRLRALRWAPAGKSFTFRKEERDVLKYIEKVLIGLLVAMLAAANSAWAEEGPWVGVWKLVASEFRFPDGSKLDTLGSNPAGLLIYTASGYTSAHYSRSDIPKFSSEDRRKAKPEETKILSDGYLSYWGRYEFDPAKNTLTLHVDGCSFPNWTGTDLYLTYEMSNDRLILKRENVKVRDQIAVGVFTWARVQ
jgi:hypothetical protein